MTSQRKAPLTVAAIMQNVESDREREAGLSTRWAFRFALDDRNERTAVTAERRALRGQYRHGSGQLVPRRPGGP